MKKSISLLMVIAVLLCACLTACTGGSDNKATSAGTTTSGEAQNDGKADPSESGEVNTTKDASGQTRIDGFKSFSGQTLDGEAVDATVFEKAKLTVVNVWGTFCSPCIEEMPYLGELAKEYENKGVQIIGIVGDVYNSSLELDDSIVEDAKSIVHQTGADYMHIVPDTELFRQLLTNMTAFPTTYFIDSNGTYVGKAVVGSLDKGSWEKKIESALASMK